MENSSTKVLDAMTPEMNLWAAVRRHWIVAALTTATVFGGMAFKTLREPGVYRSEALIVIANKVSLPIVQDTETEEFAENLPTEIEILQSQSLLNRAIRRLDPQYRNIPVWEIDNKLSLRQPEQTNILAISYEDGNATRAKAVMEALVDTYLEYSEESRRSPVANAINFIEARIADTEASLAQSSQALTAFRTQHDLDDPNASVQLAYSTKEQLQQSLATAEGDLKLLEDNYQALREQMVQIGQDPDTAITEAVLSQDSSYRSFLEQLNQLEVEYELAQTRYTPNHPLVQELAERREELRQLVESERQEFLNRQPRVDPNKKVELGEIQQNLALQLWQTDLERSAQQERIANLRQQESTANSKLQGLLQLQQQYQELSRQYELNTQTLNGLSEKLQELRIQEAQDTFSWKVIEEPNLPTIPIARSRIRGLVLGLITGVLAGVGVAYFLEKIDTRLREVQEIKALTDLPILGVIPQAETATEVNLQTSDTFTEAIRSLALALSFQTGQGNGKVVAITSAIAGEGKTTITYNLGLALTELNKRVLILDANLAHPHLHEVFDLDNDRGLTTAIATEQSWRDLLQAVGDEDSGARAADPEVVMDLPEVTTVESRNGMSKTATSVFARVSTAMTLTESGLTLEPNVQQHPDILTTGPVSAASFPWLVSAKMQQLLQEWRDSYDYILVDTSDVTGLADAQSLTPKVDQVICVASLNRVDREQFSHALDLLKRNNSQMAGIVVNTARPGKGKEQNRADDLFS